MNVRSGWRKRWPFILLVAIALFSAIRFGGGPWLDNPALLAGAVAGLCRLAAVAMLFTSEGRGWTARKPSASAQGG